MIRFGMLDAVNGGVPDVDFEDVALHERKTFLRGSQGSERGNGARGEGPVMVALRRSDTIGAPEPSSILVLAAF